MMRRLSQRRLLLLLVMMIIQMTTGVMSIGDRVLSIGLLIFIQTFVAYVYATVGTFFQFTRKPKQRRARSRSRCHARTTQRSRRRRGGARCRAHIRRDHFINARLA